MRMGILLAWTMVAAIGCGPQHPVVKLDPALQKFPAENIAVVRLAQKVPLERYRGLAVITPPDCRIIADEVSQLKALGYFEEVVGLQDLTKFVTEQELLENPVPFDKWSDYQTLAKAYKPFLILRFQCIREGDIWYRLTVTDPETVENLFVSEVRVWTQAGYFIQGLLTLGGGLTIDDDCVGDDEDVRLPLYNALLEWINANR